MASPFAFENRDYAAEWIRSNGPDFDYAVNLQDVEALTHRGDMGWIDAMNDFRSFQGVEACALRYWSGDPQSERQH